MTFSVVAYDKERREWGVGVASRYLSVGSVVPWAKAGVGAIATQSYANYSYGPKGLELLQEHGAKEVVDILTGEDTLKEKRQVGVVDSRGNSFSFTGSECHEFAGHFYGNGFSVQGNILAGKEVIDAMVSEMNRPGMLEDRIIRALFAADRHGGDSRGRQSSALLVVSESRHFEEGSDVVYDIRVEDHRDPLGELNRIIGLWKATSLDRSTIDIDGNADSINKRLSALGYAKLEDWAYANSLENSVDAGKIGQIAFRILMGETNPGSGL
ncbi:MAG: DUF1028 domain-containing protein [Thermoplasmataceae archaeon]